MRSSTIYSILLFIALQIIAFTLYSNSSNINYVGSVRLTSWLIQPIVEYKQLLTTSQDNKLLSQRIATLEGELLESSLHIEKLKESYYIDSALLNTSNIYDIYTISATVIAQSILKEENYIGIDKGFEDGVTKGMSIISNGGVIGYVAEVNSSTSSVRSILSKSLKTAVLLKKNSSFCSLWWDGESPYEVNFSEMTKYSEAAIGDTISVAPFSSNFVRGLNIGTIKEIYTEQGQYFVGKIKLLADIKQLGYITAVQAVDNSSSEYDTKPESNNE